MNKLYEKWYLEFFFFDTKWYLELVDKKIPENKGLHFSSSVRVFTHANATKLTAHENEMHPWLRLAWPMGLKMARKMGLGPVSLSPTANWDWAGEEKRFCFCFCSSHKSEESAQTATSAGDSKSERIQRLYVLT